MDDVATLVNARATFSVAQSRLVDLHWVLIVLQRPLDVVDDRLRPSDVFRRLFEKHLVSRRISTLCLGR